MFNVRGDSMRGASIEDGDKVVVDRSLQARNNDIIIAVVEGDYTIKRLHQQYGRIELRPDNPAYQAIVLSAERPLEVWGVVVGVVRRLKRAG
jgi:DNA polymerase V